MDTKNTEVIDADLLKLLHELGYAELRMVNGLVCGLRRQIYTCGMFIGLDQTGMQGRFCFDTCLMAELFLAEWDGKTMPDVGDDGCTAIKWQPRSARRAEEDRYNKSP